MCYSRELVKELAFGDVDECGFEVEADLWRTMAMVYLILWNS